MHPLMHASLRRVGEPSEAERDPHGFRRDGSARPPQRCLIENGAPDGRPAPAAFSNGVPVLDLLFLLGIIALFAIVGLAAKAVERL